jgi:hypothetical protein
MNLISPSPTGGWGM